MAKLLGGIALAVLLITVAIAWLLAPSPSVEFTKPVTSVGEETPVEVRVSNARGVRRLSAWVEQNGKLHPVYTTSAAAQPWRLFGAPRPPEVLRFNAGRKQAAELKDGPAQLIVEAQSAGIGGKKGRAVSPIQVNTQPPSVSADGHQHYINQGGSELVTFRVSGSWNGAGVRVGRYTFRSWPMPGRGEEERFSLFAFPHDVPAETVPLVYVRNAAGAEATARFWFRAFPKTFRQREIPLDDGFLRKVTSELDPQGSGSLLERFLRINRDMRQANNQALADLRLKSEQKVLWQGPFYRLGKVESFFADHRTYLYGGKQVDRQWHLGFDLSDVQGAPVKAANAGRVIHAAPLGIYGNCVVIDHGYGLQSIYGHMRQIGVKPGDLVSKEQVVGRSGDTGLAGGDHLHFSMQVDGVQVQPIEWWDAHWIQDRILSKLETAKSAAR